ncbi:thiamin pyrophosphokinase [Streptococcus pseudoporcinus]|uniref:Thiamine diphosphokinase n=1 Tax=Streptococcus pseudoporcinus TaxID=361101 RepID=A0A4U9XKH4_9STRE|nr:thiamine diphosphokinase [Streptococcus pseudoporcinus]VTS13794.1 thiamin pyrophosphokinase [Streptococcus pseudoporcinus]
MLNIALVAGGDLQAIPRHFDLYCGIDRGSLFVIEENLPLTYAVGDFDSVSESELSRIKMRTKHMVQSPAEKNDTDTELALKTVFGDYPEAEVTIFGAFGGRLDHLLANLYLPSNPDLKPFMSQISLVDQQNHVQFRPSGCHLIHQVEGMTYVSFMTTGQNPLTIKGAKYDLTSSNYFEKKIYSSNEFIGQPIEVSVNSDDIIIIQSRDRS